MNNAPPEKPGINFGTFTLPFDETRKVVSITTADGRTIHAAEFVDDSFDDEVAPIVVRYAPPPSA